MKKDIQNLDVLHHSSFKLFLTGPSPDFATNQLRQMKTTTNIFDNNFLHVFDAMSQWKRLYSQATCCTISSVLTAVGDKFARVQF